MNDVKNYILSCKNYFIANPDAAEAFFADVLLNERIFYKNLKSLSDELFEKSGSPVPTQSEMEDVVRKSKTDTVSEILKELAKTNLFFNTKAIDTDEPYFGVTPQGNLVADVLINPYRNN